MKKLFSALLALSLAVSLAACSAPADESVAAESTAPESTASESMAAESTAATDGESDMAYVQDKGTLVVGITDFAPMDYREEGSDEWVGFDADMARLFAEHLGVEVEFLEINWDNKLLELEAKGIDMVWNGMTLTEEVMSGSSTSIPYCNNGQVVVVPQDMAADYQDEESLADLSFAAENGSAGAEQLDELGLEYLAVDTQAKALLEVASGASEACVIDLLMAGAMIGEGTSYPDLTYTVQLNSEEYGTAFRVGSDLTEEFNTFWQDAYTAGTVMEVAEVYGVQESIVAY